MMPDGKSVIGRLQETCNKMHKDIEECWNGRSVNLALLFLLNVY
jgi:hypothetical protein